MKNLLLFTICMGLLLMVTHAQQTLNSNDTLKNPYVTRVFTDENGNEIAEVIVPGRPPDNYRAPVAPLPDPNNRNANVLANVPAFSWCFGCSATSAAMIAGYYDRTGYDNMYTGPTNGGVMPMNNSSWPNVIINGETRSQCPLSATRMGVDGRTEKGHVDDYWYMYGSEQDPYYGNWTQHEHGDCTADYMGTNQFYNWQNNDGWTVFYYYNSGAPLYDYTGCEPGQKDGCHGFRQFIESRGYDIQAYGNFTQLIYGYQGNTQGFTYEEFKGEIDAGRPVMIQVEGHTMVGFGYDDSGESELVYIHDTWDYNNHTMEWGGTYSGMQQYAVTVMMLEPLETGILAGQVTALDGATPIEGATVSAGSFSAVTNSSGNYTISDLPAGTYQVTASHPQYITSDPETVTITPGTTTYQDFSLAPAASSITLFTPNGGEFFVQGSEAMITWETTATGNVKIEYSSNNGSNWTTISGSVTASLQSYVWTVPEISSGQCLVKISDAANLSVSDMSDNNFEIGPQNLLGGPYKWDENTVLLMHFEGDYHNQSPLSGDGVPQGTGLSFVNNELDGLGKCIEFDRNAGNPLVSVPHNSNLSLEGDWTLETWFKASDYDDYYQYFVVKPGDGDEYLSNYAMQMNSYWDDVIFTYYFTSAEQRIGLTGITPSLNQWYHLAFIRDTQNNTVRLIIHDSNLSKLFDSQINDTGTDPLNNVQDVMIGLYYRGLLDELRISNVVRNYDDLVQADFTADVNYGEAPLEVTFSDLSSGSPAIWEWDFDNDGTIDSQVQNPVWTYSEPGTYSVRLTVGDGISYNTKTKTNYITVTANPGQVPPQNLVVDNLGYAVWEAPQTQNESIITHHGGYSGNGIGTGSAASWISAARFDATDLAPYYGSSLNAVNLHICENLFSYVELRIYEGGTSGDPGTLIYAQDITDNVLINHWTTIPLTSPISLQEGNEYWIGYYIDAIGGYPSSKDFGPAIPGKGDWMNFNGTWVEISIEYNLDCNWCIEGVVTTSADGGGELLTQRKILSHPPRQTTSDGTPQVSTVSLPVHQRPANGQRDLLGYNVYLNGSQVDNTTNLYHQFTGLNPGQTYTAGVTAVYDNGESMMITDQFTYPEVFDSYALSFDGSDDVATFGGFSYPTGDLTLEVWMRPTAMGNTSEIMCGINYSNYSTFQLRLESNGALLYGESPDWTYMVTDPCTELNQWHHVAVVREGSNTYLYLNGEQKVIGTVNEGVTPTSISIGGRSWNMDRLFSGDIDEVRIWSVARTPAEIAENMNTYLTGSETGLLGYWKMNEGSGQLAYDETSNNHNFQLGTTSGTDINDPEWIPTDWPYGLFADFTADVTSGNAPLTVAFTNLSSSQALSSAWDFQNDGVIDSYDEHPEFTYINPGVYSVSLTVSDNSTGTYTETKTDYITVLDGSASITEVIASQRTDGSKMVDISYNLSGAQSSYPIILEVSFNNGSTFQEVTEVSGDIGTVAPGTGLQITWDAGAEYTAGIYHENVIARVLSFDPSILCVDGLYSSGCGSGDGLTSWDMANINLPSIPCTGIPPWYHNYMDLVHDLTPGETYELTVTAGYSTTWFAIWVDWDNNQEVTTDEMILDGLCANTNTPYTFDFVVPADAPFGEFVMRARTNWNDPVTDPCTTYSYGNCIDFLIETGSKTNSSVKSSGLQNGGIHKHIKRSQNQSSFTENTTYGESPAFTMDTKNPEVGLSAPNGGGIYSYQEMLDITWTATDDTFEATPVSAGISTEEGGAVTWLASNIANSGTTQVDPPDVATLFAKVHVNAVDAFGNEGNDASDDYFELVETIIPLDAEFSANVTEGDAPLTVLFTDLSTGDPSSWEWDFENDGTIDSYLQNPEFTYTEPGLYSVSLTIYDSKGSDTETKTDYITVLEEAGTISEVIASQRTDGSKMVDVSYNLTGPQPSYPIILEVSFNDGSTYEEVTEVSGDVGTVEPGTGLQITWDAGTEFPAGFYYETVKMRVTAIDEGWECGDLLTDTRDGQQYETVLIGDQCWMKENLAWLPSVSPSSVGSQSEPRYYVYGYQGTDVEEAKATSNYQNDGTLYNWPAAVDVCEEIPGWHLPTNNEYKILEGFVDSQYPIGDPEWDKTNQARGFDVGKNLKSTSGWNNNGNGTDLYGYSALPSGRRRGDNRNDFMFLGTSYASWASDYYSGRCLMRELFDDSDQSTAYFYYKDYGFSVRCLKTEAKSKASINGTSGRNGFSGESPAFTMDTKNPEVTLNTPNGGGLYSYLEMLDITWTATDDTFEATPISAGISTEEGGAVTWLVNNIANSGSTVVDPPDVATLFAKAHVKVVDAFGNESNDASDDYFELVETIIPLDAEFSANVTSGDAPLSVQFTDLSTGDPSSWEWDFENDGTIDSYLQNPAFTYTDPGMYTVSLTVYDSKGFSTETKVDYISVFEPLVAEFTADVTSGDAPLTVQFTDLSTGDPSSWEWDFENDGTVDSYLQNPEFTYTESGVYSVSLTVYDGESSSTETKIDYITVAEPLVAEFTADVTSGDAPLTVQFTDLSTGDPSSWEWDFENDGTIDSYLQNPAFTYTDPGMYTVSLTVYNSIGFSTETKVDYITVDEPLVAEFTADVTSGDAPLTVQFTDLSTGDPSSWEWDFENDGSIDSYDQNPEHTYTLAGSYSVKLTIYDSKTSDTELKTNYITVYAGGDYFDPVWVSPFNPMTFYIMEANIDGAPLQEGDEVGLFDIDPSNGAEICVGAGILTQQLGGGVYLEMIASMNDGSNPDQANGFTPGNEIIYKLWSAENGEVENVLADYPYPGYDEVFTAQGNTLVELNGVITVTQDIDLETGWNLMSFRVQPDEWNMLQIVQPLINDNMLYKVLDEAGGSIFHLPFPPPNGQWTNTIGDMQNTEGYYIKVTGNSMLTMTGSPVEMPMNIPLATGWNIISYPCMGSQNALDAVQPLIDADVLFKVIDEEGGTIFHLPFPPPNGQWTNTIGNFESGEGYYLKVTGESSITFSEPGKGHVLAAEKQKAETSFFETVWENHPFMPMLIALKPDNQLLPGDEIGVFDGEICVGAAIIEYADEPVLITASQDDPQTEVQDGFIRGHAVTARIWKSDGSGVSAVDLTYLQGDETFEPLGTYVGKTDEITHISEDFINGFDLNIMPNPFEDEMTISLNVPDNATVEVVIYNLMGQSVLSAERQILRKGLKLIQLKNLDFEAGTYLLKITIHTDDDQFSRTSKIIKK